MPGNNMAFAAFATKGLEDVLEGEIGGRAGTTVRTTRTKLVLFDAPYTDRLRDLRVADDICAVAGDPAEASTVDELRGLLRRGADLGPVVALIGGLRELSGEFSVTVTAARAPAGTAKELLEVVTAEIADRYELTPSPPDTRAPFDVRLFVDGSFVVVGARLFEVPLSNRAYRVVGAMGSLRPTVAAAMVRLACPPGDARRVWDPFCGSGTILAEAFLQGHSVTGGDLDLAAVAAARENLGTLRHDLWAEVQQADATSPRTWQQHASADTVVTNMPWGKQVPIASRVALYSMVGQGVAGKVAAGGRACVLTVEPERLVAQVRRNAPDAVTAVRRIGLLGQTPSIVTVTPR